MPFVVNGEGIKCMNIIDVHAHYGRWFFPILADRISDTLALMERNAIERCVLSSTLAVVYDYVEGNEELARDIEGYPELHGYVTVNPNYAETSIEQVDRFLTRPQFVGVKIHPDYTGQPADHGGNVRILEHVADGYKGTRVLIHTWGEEGVRAVAKMTGQFPELTFIWGHMGGTTDWSMAAQWIGKFRNGYLEICSSTPEQGKIQKAVATAGAEKILFGSDMTLLNPAFSIGMVMDAPIPEVAKRCILHDNAQRVFRFEEG